MYRPNKRSLYTIESVVKRGIISSICTLDTKYVPPILKVAFTPSSIFLKICTPPYVSRKIIHPLDWNNCTPCVYSSFTVPIYQTRKQTLEKKKRQTILPCGCRSPAAHCRFRHWPVVPGGYLADRFSSLFAQKWTDKTPLSDRDQCSKLQMLLPLPGCCLSLTFVFPRASVPPSVVNYHTAGISRAEDGD